MRKIIGFIVVILIIVGGILGYKVVYKVSPRDFITKETRVIYANEGINTKDFNQFLPFLDPDVREKFRTEIKNLKYISNIYFYSDKEFYEINDKNITMVLDPGLWYFLALKEIGKKFDFKDGVYILKNEIKEKYKDKIGSQDIFMKPYRGVFILSLNEKNIKDLIEKDGKYFYNKEIENTLDLTRDNLIGTLIYNNQGNEFYGIQLLTVTGKIEDERLKGEIKLIFDEQSSKKYATTSREKELAKYVNRNDLYLSVDDFSIFEEFIFNPYIFGDGLDKQTMIAIWQGFFGVNISDMLKEVDGEAVFKYEDSSIMFKMKPDFSETKKFLELLNQNNSVLAIDGNISVEGNIIKVGRDEFKENPHPYIIPKDSFIFGEFDFTPIISTEDLKINVNGKDREIELKVDMSIRAVQEFTKGY